MGDAFCKTNSIEMCKGLERHLGDRGSLPVEEKGVERWDNGSTQVHSTTHGRRTNAQVQMVVQERGEIRHHLEWSVC